MPFSFQGLKEKSKVGFDKVWDASEKYVGVPMNRWAGKLGAEAVWPTDMPSECDKASRILRVFTIDREHAPEKLNVLDAHAAKKQQKVIQRIPADAIKAAQGIAIFTVFRSGLVIGGGSGGGLVMARTDDGTWSAPSGIIVNTFSFGFLVGLDVYDVVILLNTKMAVESFCNPKVTLGADISLVAGPVGHAAIVDAGYRQPPAWYYVKSKGLYAGAQLDGSFVLERNDENAKFYYGRYSAREILAGKVRMPVEAQGLLQTLRAAEGQKVDLSLIPAGDAPSERPPMPGVAPPNYDDLDIINVKCSQCGAKMTPDMLVEHKCENTQPAAASPANPPPSLPQRARPVPQVPVRPSMAHEKAEWSEVTLPGSQHEREHRSHEALPNQPRLSADEGNAEREVAIVSMTAPEEDKIELIDATSTLDGHNESIQVPPVNR